MMTAFTALFTHMLRWGFEEIEPLFSQTPALPSIKMPAKSMHQSFSEPPLVWCRWSGACKTRRKTRYFTRKTAAWNV